MFLSESYNYFFRLYMVKIIIIGAGGVGRVVTQKCAQLSSIFSEIILASRTLKKCDDIAIGVKAKYEKVKISTTQVDAMMKINLLIYLRKIVLFW